MRGLRGIVFRLAALFGRRDRERDLDAELRFHLEEEAEAAAAAGLSAAEAERAARRSLGDVGRTKEAVREAWTWPSLERLAQDLRYAVRVLRRRPGFTVTALVSLALGIGASTAVFSLLKSIQLDRLPVDRPNDLVQIADERGVNSAYPTYEALRGASRTLADVFGSGVSPTVDLVEGSEWRQAVIEFVTENYFGVLGVSARRGRVFHPPVPGAPSETTAVISNEYWRMHFAGDPSALGARFRFPYTGIEFTVVGIAPPAFRGVHLDMPALVLLVIGFAIGLPAGIVVVRFVSSMLFELQPGDPVTIVATLGTLTIATLAAAYLPARRAASIDPIQALREDR